MPRGRASRNQHLSALRDHSAQVAGVPHRCNRVITVKALVDDPLIRGFGYRRTEVELVFGIERETAGLQRLSFVGSVVLS